MIDGSLASATSVVFTLLSEANLENVPNPTIVRIRGNIHLVSTAAAADNARTQITMGIMVVDVKAFTAGISALELPATGIGGDWLWWDTRTIDIAVASATAEDTALGIRHNIEVDNKAMRKVGLNQVLVLIAQNENLNSAHTVQLSAALRILLKR